jgi:L-fuconolactonase
VAAATSVLWAIPVECEAGRCDDCAATVGSKELAASMAPLLTYCIEQFGPNRCMFESNFPVDTVAFAYNVMYNAFKRLSKGYSDAERTAMFHDTATRVYRIDV